MTIKYLVYIMHLGLYEEEGTTRAVEADVVVEALLAIVKIHLSGFVVVG